MCYSHVILFSKTCSRDYYFFLTKAMSFPIKRDFIHKSEKSCKHKIIKLLWNWVAFYKCNFHEQSSPNTPLSHGRSVPWPRVCLWGCGCECCKPGRGSTEALKHHLVAQICGGSSAAAVRERQLSGTGRGALRGGGVVMVMVVRQSASTVWRKLIHGELTLQLL